MLVIARIQMKKNKINKITIQKTFSLSMSSCLNELVETYITYTYSFKITVLQY